MNTILDLRPIDTAREEDVFCHFLQGGHETTIRRGGLWREAARYSNLLQRHGVCRGDVVVIVLPHSPDLLYSFLGAMLLGAIPSFMPQCSAKQDAQLYWVAHEKLFARLGSGALLTSGENFSAITKNIPGLTLGLIDAAEAVTYPAQFDAVEVAAEDVALLQHSSGTTGLKKGVALSHRAILRQVESYGAALKLQPDDRIVSWLPLYHDMGLIACFLLPLIAGLQVVMIDPFEWVVNPRLLFDAITRFRGTLCWQPNFAFHHLCRTVRPSAEFDLSSMRVWNDCSEPCRTETLQLFARIFAGSGTRREQLQVCYAMAETVFAVAQTAPGHIPRELEADDETLRVERRISAVVNGRGRQTLLSAGRVVSGLQVRIIDAAGAIQGEDRIGIIAIAGDCLFEGYFKLEQETRRKWSGGWYHTGDLGLLHEGELYVTGRAHDLIIVHGRNYYAHELEFLVNQVAGVHAGRNVAVGWYRPEIGSEDVVIIAEPQSNAAVEPGALIQAIKHKLLNEAGLLVFDVHLVTAGWLAKTTSGKLSRSAHLAKYLSDVGRAVAA